MSVDAQALCLQCGMCCNGVIFADGQLRPSDDRGRLSDLGLVLKLKNSKFRQPCAALSGCRCTIYSERPEYCRKFECSLLQSVSRGELSSSEAEKIIRRATRAAQRVLRLLRRLGDGNEHLPLSARFRAAMRRFEAEERDPQAIQDYGELTIAMHRLNVVLSERFYPE
jgi:uncharacterized protein